MVSHSMPCYEEVHFPENLLYCMEMDQKYEREQFYVRVSFYKKKNMTYLPESLEPFFCFLVRRTERFCLGVSVKRQGIEEYKGILFSIFGHFNESKMIPPMFTSGTPSSCPVLPDLRVRKILLLIFGNNRQRKKKKRQNRSLAVNEVE